MTFHGYRVQPGITIPDGAQSITIGKDGVVTVVAGDSAPTQVGQLQLADFINPAGLSRRARTSGESLPAAAARRHAGLERPGLLSRARWKPRTSTSSKSS